FPGGHEHDRAKSCLCGIGGSRRARVSGRRARNGLCAEANSLRDRNRHPAILERAGGILAFVLEENSVALIKTRRALGMRDDLRLVDVEHTLAKPPHAALVNCFTAVAARVEQVSHTRRAPLRATGAMRESDSIPSIARR